jgi:hypothetical protein
VQAYEDELDHAGFRLAQGAYRCSPFSPLIPRPDVAPALPAGMPPVSR